MTGRCQDLDTESSYVPEGKPTTSCYTRKENGNWHHLRRTGHANGHGQSVHKGKVLRVWRTRTLQTRLPRSTKDQGGGIMKTQLLLGSSPNGGEDQIKSQGGKRWCRAVNNLTRSAKDLVSSGTLSLPASRTYSSSVVINVLKRLCARRLEMQQRRRH